MKLYWSPRSRASRAAWMLEEAGLKYERVTINLGDPEAREDLGFMAASPLLKVPAIEDGEVRMADSAAICMYVADRYPLRELAPAVEDPRRGAYLFWMTYVPGCIEPAVNERNIGVEPTPRTNGWGDFDRVMETLEKGLQPGPWLLADHFTAADVMVGGSVVILNTLGILPQSETLLGYLERCTERPAFQTALGLEMGWRSVQTKGARAPSRHRRGSHGRR